MIPLELGQVTPMKTANVVHGGKDPYIKLSYRAPKGQNFVFFFLGVESDDGSAPLDLEARMNALGWIRDKCL